MTLILKITEHEAMLLTAATQFLVEISGQMGAKSGNYEANDLRVTLNEQLAEQGFDPTEYARKNAQRSGTGL